MTAPGSPASAPSPTSDGAPKIVIFGSVNMDLSIETARIPQAGETLAGGGFITNAGGKGANQAVACARLGAKTLLVGAVGADAFGHELTAGLTQAGVGCSQLQASERAATGVAVILRCDGDNRIILSPGANHELTGEQVAQALAQVAVPGDVFLTQGECDFDATLAALHAARELGMFTVFNPAPAPTHPVPDTTWRDVDLVCLNETECSLLTGIEPDGNAGVARAAARLAELGVGTVVVTLGERGSMAWRDGALTQVPAERVSVVDTTAAGDTFIGALLSAHVAGLPLEHAMRRGSAASALAVGRLGAQQSIPTLGEVREHFGDPAL